MAIQPTALLSLRDVVALTTLRRSTLQRSIDRGEFPAPVQIGPRRIAWKRHEVIAWLDSRPRATQAENGGRSPS